MSEYHSALCRAAWEATYADLDALEARIRETQPDWSDERVCSAALAASQGVSIYAYRQGSEERAIRLDRIVEHVYRIKFGELNAKQQWRPADGS